MKTRIEKPVRNNPGISREFRFNPVTQKWVETGKLRAIRRVIENGKSKKEQAVFDNIEDAKKFRTGHLEKAGSGQSVHKLDASDPNQKYTFGALVEDWRALHYLQIEFTSRQQYETRMPHLQSLRETNVSDIDASVVNKLVQNWASKDYPKPRDRQKFDKELDLLKIILNFYRKHKNHAYYIPILPDHYKAADLAKKAQRPVRGIKERDVPRFLGALKQMYPHFYVIALTQIGFGLRIGEAVGLCWEDFDLERRFATIQRNIAWNRETRQLVTKNRKNAKILEVGIPEFLVEVLIELKTSQEPGTTFLFQRKGELVRRQQVSKAYNRVLQSLGIMDLSGTHILRKTAGTLVRKLTRDIYAAKKLLDHSSVSITEQFYQEELDEDKVKVASVLNDVLRRTTTGKSGGSDPCGTPLPSPVPQCPAKPNRPKLTLVKSIS